MATKSGGQVELAKDKYPRYNIPSSIRDDLLAEGIDRYDVEIDTVTRVITLKPEGHGDGATSGDY